jgi:hypothetical protein
MRKKRDDLKPRKAYADDDFAVAGGDDDEKEDPKPLAHLTEDDDYFGENEPSKVMDDEGENEIADEPMAMPQLKKGAKPPAQPVKAQPAKRRVVQMGTPAPAKLSKKAQASLAEWRGKNHGKKVASLVTANIESARKKFGHRGVFHGAETKDLVIGIPIPALSFEFLIGQDVFPLGLVLQIVAKHGTGKSGLVAEFGRWFDLAGGLVTVNENETKFSPEWYESIMGSELFNDRLQLNRCDSVESWQEHMSHDIANYKKLLEGTKENPGPGRTLPLLMAVDSVMGKMSIQSQDNVKKEGSAGRGFPVEALIISRYMRTVPQWLDGWPFAIVLVNHLSLRKNEDTNQEERHKAGGVLINFQESFELEMRKVGPKKVESQDFEGFQVDISCEKNSFGPTHRQIRARVLWWEEPDEETGDYKQKTVWDWDWSTTHLLFSILNGDRNVRLRKNLKDAGFHMEFKSPTALSASAWSKTLGVSEKEALPWNEMGALIRQTPQVQDMLRQALRIKRRPLLQGDYLEQMDKLAEELP